MRTCWLIALFVLFCRPAAAQDAAPAPLRVAEARPDETMNGKFAGASGWIGGDGIHSIPLPDESLLWVFGDTLVGQIRDGKRHDLSMVNNSFARQRGRGEKAQVELHLNRDSRGRAVSYITPKDKDGYYWLWDGLVEQGKLFLFATRLTSPGTITAFDWKLLDQALIVIDNPLDPPERWSWRQFDFPFGAFTDDYEALWGMEVIRSGDDILVYGTQRRGKDQPRSLAAARVSPGDLTNFDRWMFYSQGDWQPQATAASELTTHVGTEGSVTWLPRRKRYVYVYSPPLDPRIQMRTANSPLGPWSEAVTIYTCPEAAWDQRIFCYAGKARLAPGEDDELLVSYATNSFEMLPHVTADARIYMPRFVRVRLE